MKGYICFNHQGKANAFCDALSKKYRGYGWDDNPISRAGEIAFVLSDSDVAGRIQKLKIAYRHGIKRTFVYPHSARPSLINDIYPAWEHTTAQFVVSPGHTEILRRYGYSKPIHEVGWYLCPLRTFQKKERVRSVLFAPIHPRNSDIDKDVNRRAFELLKKCAIRDEIQLTVRHIGALVENGLESFSHPNVNYFRGERDLSFSQIDEADVVIGHQTFAWLAVARGAPTVMMGEGVKAHIEPKIGKTIYVKSWDKYKDLLMYPLDLLEPPDTIRLLNRAAQSDAEISEWRSRMIGEAFDGERFVQMVERYT